MALDLLIHDDVGAVEIPDQTPFVAHATPVTVPMDGHASKRDQARDGSETPRARKNGTPKMDAAAVDDALARLRERIAELEEENARLRGMTGL